MHLPQHQPLSPRHRRLRAAVVLAGIVCVGLAATSAIADPFPAVRPAMRSQAIATLVATAAPLSTGCMTPLVPSPAAGLAGTPWRKTLGFTGPDGTLASERRIVEPDGTVVRYSADRASADHVDLSDEDNNGQPDMVEAFLDGILDARRLLVDQLDLPRPGPLEIVLLRLNGPEGVLLPPEAGGRAILLLEANPKGGAGAARRAAAHQYAHAVVSALGTVSPSWGEAFAVWTGVRLAGGPDARTAELFSRRMAHLSAGLLSDDPEVGAGNALWFSFLEEEYGSTTVALTLRELGTGAAAGSALDRALRRGAGSTLEAAFREFHLWTVLVGDRSDGKHFPFAQRLASPHFAASVEGLPVLSVHAEPPVGSVGATTIRVATSETEGGITLRFEGEFPGRWEADLLLVGREGGMRRVRVPLGPEAGGEITVPVQGLKEALLLARNLEPEDRGARRFTWAAHHDRAYPFELSSLAAVRSKDGGTLISWETSSENGLVGFNVLRVGPDGGAATQVNPVWIPAVGDLSTPGSYQFLDSSAVAGAPVQYRVEAVTLEGLSSFSDFLSPTEDEATP
jgi:hypothetical protein